MFENCVDIRSQVRVKLEHAGDQIFELLRELYVWLRMGFPELLFTIRGEELIVWIVLLSLAEGWMASIEDKKEDAKGEDIDQLTFVGLMCENFRCHIA